MLSVILILKQQFIKCNCIEHINGKYDMNNIENFNPGLLKIDKKSYENIGIYYIRYITMKNPAYIKINSVNPLYLIYWKRILNLCFYG